MGKKKRYEILLDIDLFSGFDMVSKSLKTNMEQMIRKLYLYMRKEENHETVISREFQEEIVGMLKSEIEEETEMEFEKIRDLAFMIGVAGEENGFVKGFKYAYHLFTECVQK